MLCRTVLYCVSLSLRHSSRIRKSIEEAMERIRMKFDRAHTNYTNILCVCMCLEWATVSADAAVDRIPVGILDTVSSF